MQSLKPLIIILFLIISVKCYSQKFSVGFLNGVNRSNINGNQESGRWMSKPGPVSGIFFNYSPFQMWSLQTEISKMTIYYEEKTYNYPIYWLDKSLINSSIMPYYYMNYNWNYSFYRIPFQLKFSTPTRIKFNLSAGIYFSYRYDYSDSYNNTPPKYDFGYIYSAGFSYPITNSLKVFVDGRYTSGRRVFVDQINGRNGTAEMVFGIGYYGFWDRKNHSKDFFPSDSSNRHVLLITYKSGFSESSNSGHQSRNGYSSKGGFLGGVSFDYYLNKNFAISSGLTFEQKGYRFKDSSVTSFIYNPVNYPASIYNNCKVDINYIVIPLLLKLKFGGKLKYYINGGLYSGMRLNARVTGTSKIELRGESYTLNEYTVYDDIDGNIKDNDWGWVLGGGILIPFYNKYSLEIGCNYNSGWKNILDVQPSMLNSGADKTIKNKSLNFTVGFQIPIL